MASMFTPVSRLHVPSWNTACAPITYGTLGRWLTVGTESNISSITWPFFCTRGGHAGVGACMHVGEWAGMQACMQPCVGVGRQADRQACGGGCIQACGRLGMHARCTWGSGQARGGRVGMQY